MLVAVTAVARHGSLVGDQVIVQSAPMAGIVAVQPANVAVVIVNTAALATLAVSDELVQDEVRPAVAKNPMLFVVSV
jgi:hypothetical protein